ncbi:MAG: acyltransferase [Lachnospiraceae bacterium]|nr:acyltransferase [Lachnospiraceae bacterium]
MSTTPTKKVRESGLELGRMIIMFQIVFLHVCTYGNYAGASKAAGGIHEFLFYLIWLMCRGPVLLLIMIMGYFTVTKQQTVKQTFPKIKSLYLPMIFYSIFLHIAALIVDRVSDFEVFTTYGKSDLISAFVPFTHRTWYFLTLYIMVLIVTPYLNMVLQKISKQEYLTLLGILGFMFCIWQPLSKLPLTSGVFQTIKVFTTEGGKSYYDFLFAYIIGGYLRLHFKEPFKKNWHNLAAFIGLGVFNTGLCFIYEDYKRVVPFNDNLIVLIQCIFFIIFFKNLKIQSRVINAMAATNLGIYMIHEQPQFRRIIWKDWLVFTHQDGFYSTWKFPIKILLVCSIVYFGCMLVEFGRIYLFKAVGALYNRARQKKNLIANSSNNITISNKNREQA